MVQDDVVVEFHRKFHSERCPWGTRWMGQEMVKNPFDLLVYAEILYEIQPDTIIETGTHAGGSALFLANICDILEKGKVVSVDTVDKPRPQHKRITYVTGNSLNVDVRPEGKTLVILDSDHSKEHVLKELERYAPMVSKSSYLIVEDTNVGNPVDDEGDPSGAVAEFMQTELGNGFIVDTSREKYLISQNPGGYLKKL